jgi:hypothetical protein
LGSRLFGGGTFDRSTPNAFRVFEYLDRVLKLACGLLLLESAVSCLAAVTVATSARLPRSYQSLVHQQVHPSRGRFPISNSQRWNEETHELPHSLDFHTIQAQLGRRNHRPQPTTHSQQPTNQSTRRPRPHTPKQDVKPTRTSRTPPRCRPTTAAEPHRTPLPRSNGSEFTGAASTTFSVATPSASTTKEIGRRVASLPDD